MNLQNKDLIDLAQTLIRFPSVTPEDRGVMPFIADYLIPHGFEIKPFPDGPSENPNLVQNLLATWDSGRPGPHFCFMGHVDVVSPGNEADWSSPPFDATIRNDQLIGRGIVDMKGAIAAFINACTKDQSSYSGTISILLTGDEEGDATYGIRSVVPKLISQGIQFDACLVGEPTSLQKIGDTVKHGARASTNIDIILEGKQGHVAYHESTINPLKDLAILIQSISNLTWEERTESFPMTHVEFTTIKVNNDTVNIIPQKAMARLNIRHDPGYSVEEILEIIRALTANLKSTISIALHSCSKPYYTPPGPFMEVIENVIFDVMGIKPHFTTAGGTSDARFLPDTWPVIELGLKSDLAHHINESCHIQELYQLAKLYQKLLKHFLR